MINAPTTVPARVAEFELIPAATSAEIRMAKATAFVERLGNRYPVVAKPDVGERGAGVAILDSERALREYLAHADRDVLLQEYVPGPELGIYYYRMPDEATGHIFGITEKRLQSVVGDGQHTLERLILDDERAMRQAGVFFERHASRLLDVPAQGEVVPLGDLGNHCRGAVFTDGARFATAELTAAIDATSKQYEGFYVGRYDVRAPSEADLMAGRNLVVLELNGVSSEATNIYDPTNSLWAAWGTLFAQWRIVFAIADANRRAGHEPMPSGGFGRHVWRHLRGASDVVPSTLEDRPGTSARPAALGQ